MSKDLDPYAWPHLADNWEGSFTDQRGRRWWHAPYRGWRLDDSPPPFLVPRAPWWQRWRS